ncbi:hypothetical protein [Catellatospora citrea]|uniref:Uncharacterized protein n=1 Tax=Catellatospora citrea TaxID=53366 RepID=A0A8J3KJ71_9ACTN|nr:hypothetical protein [Catellatospora citrea]GIF96994.1 hypothetical protein Cci01nite_20880 [Catellatospora citrea]
MSGSNQVGRAKVWRHVGRARIRSDGVAKVVPAELTAVMAVPDPAVPVFVDDSGRRRRRIRSVAFAVACAVVVLAAVAWLSLSAGLVRPIPATTCAPAADRPSSQCGRR